MNYLNDNPKKNIPPNPHKESPRYKKIRRILLYSVLGLVFTFLFLMLSINNAWFGFSPLPTFEQLENPNSALATEIYAEEGELLGKFYIENRTNVRFEDLHPQLVNCLVATEDVRFYRHSGIDFYGLSTAIYRTIFQGNTSGASTITQQLAKNLFHERSYEPFQRIIQKLKEWIIAIKLERAYTKNEILTMYLNTVPFNYGVHGIKAAAKTYFNTEPKNLKVEDSAVLVGMLKGSTFYNPVRNPENATQRRNVVLNQMEKAHFITAAQSDSLKKTPLIVNFTRSTHDEGLATYFREHLRLWLKDWAQKRSKIDGNNYDIYTSGLKVYTTINAKMQEYAEEAMWNHMKKLQEQFDKHWGTRDPWYDDEDSKWWLGEKVLIERAVKQSERYHSLKSEKMTDLEIQRNFKKPINMTIFSYDGPKDTLMSPLDSLKYYKRILSTGFLALEPETGTIKTWVGGIDYKFLKYDNVRESSKRQVGSTFKPFVYTVAIQNGWSPCQKVPNVPVTFLKGEYGLLEPWTPKNSDDKFDGQMLTLKKGLANSVNFITAYLMKEIGPEPVRELAKKMGIRSHIDPYPSICLGTPDISLIEMVGAYATFANQGTYIEPNFVMRIEDRNGIVLDEFIPKQTEVLSEQDAYTMLNMLEEVVNNGTAIRLRYRYKFENEIAGKTGTTNDHSDGWFMGVTPKLVGGVWTGGDEKKIHFRSIDLGQGANMALPIWAEFMKSVYADSTLNVKTADKFVEPPYMSTELDCSKYSQKYEPTNPFDNSQGETQPEGEYNSNTPVIETDDDEFF
ncbi:MAG: transglycosylase domain-containing protein [Chitinophagales bacterium]|nr:transglycosylase domain-containing protein [Bacteroidota bacterium]MCB9042195.1 transglycosylase domain-containing protein [Chitinophagales bacterium]